MVNIVSGPTSPEQNEKLAGSIPILSPEKRADEQIQIRAGSGFAGNTAIAESRRVAAADQFEQPMVSVIIANYNYAKYLKACVASICSQSYENIECILIDDASTDDSALIIDEIERENPRLIIHRRKVNGGQSAALLDGLSISSGQFVVFVDADDMLLSNSIASHVYVHTCLRPSPGFTCGDMLQIGENTFMSASSPPLNQFLAKWGTKRKFVPHRVLSGIVRQRAEVHEEILDNVYFVDKDYKGWAWSATSAIMFRTDALRFWASTPDLKDLRYSTDAFFCYGINAICGSVIIDIPLAIYRTHGKNGFSARLPLNHVRNYAVDGQNEHSMDALNLLVRQAKQERSYYRGLFWNDREYRAMLSYLEKCLLNSKLNKIKDRAISGSSPFKALEFVKSYLKL